MAGHVNGDDDDVGYGVRGSGKVDTTGVRGFTEKTEFDHNDDPAVVGVFGKSTIYTGVYGKTDRGSGVVGESKTKSGPGGVGVYGKSDIGVGMVGESYGGVGVEGYSDGNIGVYGQSISSVGVEGYSADSFGVQGWSDSSSGVLGYSNGIGVEGYSYSMAAVAGSSYGEGSDGVGVAGSSDSSIGVVGESQDLIGVSGVSTNSTGVYGESGGDNAPGVLGITTKRAGIGVVGINTNHGLSGVFKGNVRVYGTINKSALYFQIDHPLDPANKYLNHSSIESTDMKNLYDGVVALDEKGEAKINLPGWFGALNKDFRYQLTAIGAPGPNLYIAEEISENNTNYSKNNSNKNNNSGFKIGGGTSGMKVSWQVTGVRKDPYAKAHPIQVEEDKPDKERGYYIHPDLYDEPAEKGIDRLMFQVSSLEKVHKPLDKLKMKKDLLLSENKLKMKKRSPPKRE